MSWNIKTPGDYINGPLTVAGSATITGDLTVDTSTLKVDSANHRVGIGITAPGYNLHVGSAAYASVGTSIDSITQTSHVFKGTPDGAGYEYGKIVSGRDASTYTYGSFLAFYTEGKNSGTTDTSTERFKIDSTGVATWSNVGGVAGTAMTINSNGLGIGGNPISKVFSLKDGGTGVNGNTTGSAFGASHAQVNADLLSYAVRCTGSSLAGIGGQAYATQIIAASAQANALEIYTIGGIPLVFGTAAAERARFDSAGNFLIGTTIAPGNANCTGIRKGSTGQLILIADNGGLYHQVTSNYYLVTTAGGSTSDKTLKKNIEQLTGALSKVCAIRGVNFEFIEKPKCTADQGVQVGVIAQEVEAQYPEIVLTGDDGIKRVRYERLIAPLIEAVKELTARVVTLENA